MRIKEGRKRGRQEEEGLGRTEPGEHHKQGLCIIQFHTPAAVKQQGGRNLKGIHTGLREEQLCQVGSLVCARKPEAQMPAPLTRHAASPKVSICSLRPEGGQQVCTQLSALGSINRHVYGELSPKLSILICKMGRNR